MTLIRKISGIRGIVGESLTHEVVSRHAKAFADIQGDGPILLARDTRHHGSELCDAMAKTLLESGRDVSDYEIIPTPTAQFQIKHHQFAGGIVVTASHNPLEWNGMKFINSDGCFLNKEENNLLFNTADAIDFSTSNFNGQYTKIEKGFHEHIRHTSQLSVVDPDAVRSRKFTVVVDGVNGAASYAIPELLELLGCNVIRLHCTPDGTFPRKPEPLPENLSELSKAVRFHKADLGFAIDPDGDRLAIVDDIGSPLGEENTLVICIDGFLAAGYTSPVVTNLSTTMGVDRIAHRYGTPVLRSAVGEINVVEMMKENKSVFGGEGNGGVILAESHLGRDAVVGAAMVLSWLAEKDQPLSQYRKNLPQCEMVKDKIDLAGLDPDSALEDIDNNFPNVQKDNTDGLKLIWDDKWVHIRKSNTEPIIRIYAEAETRETAAKLVEKLKQII